MIKERLKVDWTSANRTAFIDAMIEVQDSGIFTDSGFKTAQWTAIVKGFEIRTNLEYDKQQLQNQHAELKRKYGIFSALKNNSGFGWNSDLKLPTAPSEVWDDYCSAHWSARLYKTMTLPNYEELDILFGNRVATGKFARSSAMIASKYALSTSSSLSDFNYIPVTPRSSLTAGPSTTRKTYRSNSPDFSDDFVFSDEDSVKSAPVSLSKVSTKKKQKVDMEKDLFSSIRNLTDSINANQLPPRPPPSGAVDSPLLVAGQILSDFDPPLDINDIVALKMFWCEKPDFAKLFISLIDNERSSYVQQQLRKIKL